MVQVNRGCGGRPCVLAFPTWDALGNIVGGLKAFRIARDTREVGVDAIRGVRRCTREYIANHETQSVVLPILSSAKSVDAFDDILAT